MSKIMASVNLLSFVALLLSVILVPHHTAGSPAASKSKLGLIIVESSGPSEESVVPFLNQHAERKRADAEPYADETPYLLAGKKEKERQHGQPKIRRDVQDTENNSSSKTLGQDDVISCTWNSEEVLNANPQISPNSTIENFSIMDMDNDWVEGFVSQFITENTIYCQGYRDTQYADFEFFDSDTKASRSIRLVRGPSGQFMKTTLWYEIKAEMETPQTDNGGKFENAEQITSTKTTLVIERQTLNYDKGNRDVVSVLTTDDGEDTTATHTSPVYQVEQTSGQTMTIAFSSSVPNDQEDQSTTLADGSTLHTSSGNDRGGVAHTEIVNDNDKSQDNKGDEFQPAETTASQPMMVAERLTQSFDREVTTSQTATGAETLTLQNQRDDESDRVHQAPTTVGRVTSQGNTDKITELHRAISQPAPIASKRVSPIYSVDSTMNQPTTIAYSLTLQDDQDDNFERTFPTSSMYVIVTSQDVRTKMVTTTTATSEANEDEDPDLTEIDLRQQINDNFPKHYTLSRELTEDIGEFHTFGYPDFYPSFRQRWGITVQEGRRIKLSFSDIDFEYTPPVTCTNDIPIIVIYLPPNPKRVQYCGTSPPSTIISESNKLAIFFNPKDGVAGRGFAANYSSFANEQVDNQPFVATQMTSTSHASTGNVRRVITSPGTTYASEDYHKTTPTQAAADAGDQGTTENFAKIATPRTSQNLATQNSVYVNDTRGPLDANEGVTVNFRFLGDMAESVSHEMITQQSPDAIDGTTPDYISFLDTQEYFDQLLTTEASEETSDFKCQLIRITEPGQIMTQGFPSDYTPNTRACWILISEPSEGILVQFDDFVLDSNQLEPCDLGYSHVNITDYQSYTRVLCGTEAGGKFTSFTNEMKITFDAVLGHATGFRATYSSFRKHVQGSDLGDQVCNSTEELESKLAKGEISLPVLMSRCRDISGRWPQWSMESEKVHEWLASPSYPEPIPSPSHCVWIIRGKEDQVFDIRFRSFQLENVAASSPLDCSRALATLSISDCLTGTQQVMCAARENVEFVIPSNSIQIEFISQSTDIGGFHAFYKLREASPEDEQYPSFPFTPEFAVPTSPISTHPADTITPALLTPSPDFPVLSTQSPVMVSPEVTDCNSFDMNDCGRVIMSEYGTISFVNNGVDVQSSMDFRWAIGSPNGTLIALRFELMDFGVLSLDDGQCDTRFSHVQVSISGEIHVTCDGFGPKIYVSDSNDISIVLSVLNSNGLRLCVSFATLDYPFTGSLENIAFPCSCGYFPTESPTQITTPSPQPDSSFCQFFITDGSGSFPLADFPSPYLPNVECVWTLLADPGQLVRLDFLSLDVDESRRARRCLLTDTHVQVTILDQESVTQRRFCSHSDISAHIPSARSVAVKFKSAENIQGNHTGFSMSYSFFQSVVTNVSTTVGTSNSTSTNSSSSDSFSDFGGGFRVLISDFSSDLTSLESSYYEIPPESDNRTRLVIPIDGGGVTTTNPVTATVWETMDTTLMTLDVSEPELTTFAEDAQSTTGAYAGDGRITLAVDEESVTYGQVEKMTTTSRSVDGGIESTTRSDLAAELNTLTPGKGRMTARQMELTIYICTGVGAFLVIVLIIITLYCAKNRSSKTKSGFDVDAADEANYWQTYKDWAKDWTTEPGCPVSARCGDEMAARRITEDDHGGVAPSDDNDNDPTMHVKTVSAMVNLPPVEKPARGYTTSEKLV